MDEPVQETLPEADPAATPRRRPKRRRLDRRLIDHGPPPGQPERRKRRRRRPGLLRRWILRPAVWLLLLLVLALATALWYLYRPAVQRQLLARFIPRVEEYLGRDVRVGSVRYSLFPLWLELRDVSVGGPRPNDPPIVTVRRLYVQAELQKIRKPVLELQEVQAEGVVVFLDRFLDGTDNWPRPKRRGTASKRPWELDITSFTVTDGVFRFHDDAVPMDLDARHARVSLLGMGGTDLQGRAVVESVELRLPHARPYRAAVSGKVAVHRDGMEIVAARALSPEATVSGRGVVRWRGDKRVDLKVTGSVDADLFEQLGYIQSDLVDGWLQVDGSFSWKPGVWGYRGQARASRLRALYWDLSALEASIVGDRNAVWADIDGARYGGGGITGWVEVALHGQGRGARAGRASAEPPAGDHLRRTRLQLRLDGIDSEKFLDDSHIPVGDLAARFSGTLDYRFAEADWRHGSGVGDLRLAGDPRQGHGLAIAGNLPLVIDRGMVSAQAVRLFAPGQELTGAARYALPSDTGAIDYHVDSTDFGPLAQALPVTPAPDGGAPLWLPTRGRGELVGTLQLAPGRAATDLHLALTDAVARGLAADRATGVVSFNGQAVENMRLELAKGQGAALIAGRIELAKGAPWTLGLDVAGWPVEDARPWLNFDLPVSGPFTGAVTLGGAGKSSTGTLSGEVSAGKLFALPVDRVRARLAWDDAALHVEQLNVGAAAGEASLAGPMAFPRHELQMTLAASNLDLAKPPFADRLGGLRGGLSLAGTIEGTLERPAVHGEVVGERLELAGRRLGDDGRAALRIDWGEGRLQANGSLLGLAELAGGGALDLERADLVFRLRVDELGALAGFAPPAMPELAGRAAGELRFGGPLDAPELALRLDELQATVNGTPLVAREPVRLRLAGERLRFESLDVATPGGEGELVVAGSVGLAAEAPLDLRLQGVVENSWVKPLLPAGVELSGRSDVLATVRGTAAAPKVNGQAAVRPGAQITSPSLPEPITDLQAVVLFYPDRMVIDRFSGALGGGTLQASGALEWPRPPAPESARFQIAARKVSLRYPEGWLVRGDGDLVWSIAGDDQVVRGVVTLDRALYLRDVDLGLVPLLQRFFRRQRQEAGTADEKLAHVQLNLQVQAPGTVRIKNNLADIKGTAELTFRGSLARPILFGRVEAEPGGRLVYAENTYRLERGTLTFANPYRVEPLLDLVATSRVASYDVRLALFGNLERLNASFSSDPPLPDLEVLSLLLSGSPGRLTDELARLRAPEATADNSAAEGLLLGQAASLLTQRVGNLFGFDAFRIEPLSRSGESVSSARLTVGKRISRSVYLTYSYDPSSTGGQRLQVEWRVSRGLSVLLTQEQDSYAVDVLWEHRF
ncbi:MAG TPA: translocation/assembly module TamB domain-containing protein [Thermoanaerobaculia bacterium]|nr:translocation/assembly module TamB domain-containing protein [Thermoanaerobaculia bacterium]